MANNNSNGTNNDHNSRRRHIATSQATFAPLPSSTFTSTSTSATCVPQDDSGIWRSARWPALIGNRIIQLFLFYFLPFFLQQSLLVAHPRDKHTPATHATKGNVVGIRSQQGHINPRPAGNKATFNEQEQHRSANLNPLQSHRGPAFALVACLGFIYTRAYSAFFCIYRCVCSVYCLMCISINHLHFNYLSRTWNPRFSIFRMRVGVFLMYFFGVFISIIKTRGVFLMFFYKGH